MRQALPVFVSVSIAFLLQMHVQLGVRDGNALLVKGLFHPLLHGVIDGPVVLFLAPHLAHQMCIRDRLVVQEAAEMI